MEHVIDDCTCEGRRCVICEETKCYGRFKIKDTSFIYTCLGCQKAYQKGYQKAYERNQGNDNPKVYKSKAGRTTQWRKNNPEKHKESTRQYKQTNREKIRKQGVIDQAANRARKAGAVGKYTLQEWQDLQSFYGHACLRCGRTDVKLCADHIISLDIGGANTIDNIQPLCRSCNSKKRTNITDYRKLVP